VSVKSSLTKTRLKAEAEWTHPTRLLSFMGANTSALMPTRNNVLYQLIGLGMCPLLWGTAALLDLRQGR